MKKLLIGLFMLTSVSLFAQDYTVRIYDMTPRTKFAEYNTVKSPTPTLILPEQKSYADRLEEEIRIKRLQRELMELNRSSNNNSSNNSEEEREIKIISNNSTTETQNRNIPKQKPSHPYYSVSNQAPILESPSQNSKAIWNVKGGNVKVIGKIQGLDFYKVEAEGHIGYMWKIWIENI